MFTKILVPLDGSQLSECALDPSMAIAQASKATLLLISVLPEPTLLETEDYYEPPATLLPPLETKPMRKRLEDYLDSVANSRAGAQVPFRTWVLEGNAGDCIVETAVTEHVDLIVMGTHGRSGVSRWLLGSITQNVLHHVSCPVLAVRDERPLRNVLITVDHTTLSEQALDPGFAVAGALNAAVHLLTVVEDAPDDDWAEVDIKPNTPPRDRPFATEEAYLEDLRARYGTEITVKTAVRGGKPHEAILAYASGHHIDLIVMVTRNRPGLRRWFHKSVTEQVMNNSQCSILVLKPNPSAQIR